MGISINSAVNVCRYVLHREFLEKELILKG